MFEQIVFALVKVYLVNEACMKQQTRAKALLYFPQKRIQF